MDSIVNQAAKWSYMFGGQAYANVTNRSIINRGGEQGAQHSQALHAWFSHVPGLRVVMPSTVADARDLFIASVLCKDPVIYIDDRWLYEQEDDLSKIVEHDLNSQKPKITSTGKDVTIVASGYSSYLARKANEKLKNMGINSEIIDVRILNPLHANDIIKSVKKTGKLVVVDSGWVTCGYSAEIIAKVIENLDTKYLTSSPVRIALPDAPAPTATILEKDYYTSVDDIVQKVKRLVIK